MCNISLRRVHPALRLPAYDPDSGALNAIVETPRESRNKFAYDPGSWLFRLTAVLPEGSEFPHAFGLVPSTPDADGDPLDSDVKEADDLTKEFLTEVEPFFVFYNKARGKEFEPRGWKGPRVAAKLVAAGGAKHRRKQRRAGK